MPAQSTFSRMPRRLVSLAACYLLVCSNRPAFSQDAVATAPPFKPPALQQSLGDWLTGLPLSKKMKELSTDPLQIEPFAGAPLDDPKGLAAKIKAEELDAKNRVKAVKYLGTVDCVAYPEAQDMLIQTMQEDPSEPVRYEAVKALRVMLSRGPSRDKGIKRLLKCLHADLKPILHPNPCLWLHPHKLLKEKTKHFCRKTLEKRRHDSCRGCCNEKVLNALAARAYDSDDFGCPVEPSERVRKAAVKAIAACGADCGCDHGYDQAQDQVIEKDQAIEEKKPKESKESKEESPNVPPPAPAAETEARQGRATHVDLNGLQVTAKQAKIHAVRHVQASEAVPTGFPPLEALRDYCIVGLKMRNFVKAQTQFSSVYKQRTYYFSSAAAKAEFDRWPEVYAPANSGIDPVQLHKTGSAVEGIYLREYQDRMYLFASKENWKAFLKSPETYTANVEPETETADSGK